MFQLYTSLIANFNATVSMICVEGLPDWPRSIEGGNLRWDMVPGWNHYIHVCESYKRNMQSGREFGVWVHVDNPYRGDVRKMCLRFRGDRRMPGWTL